MKRIQGKIPTLASVSTAATMAFTTIAYAEDLKHVQRFDRLPEPVEIDTLKSGRGGKKSDTPSYSLQSWMHSDVGEAWNSNYFGQGANITFVDNFSTGSGISGDLGLGATQQRHGDWTSLEGSMIAPRASIINHDFGNDAAVKLSRRNFDVINLSYAMLAADGYSSVNWAPRESSIVEAAHNGQAVISKAAGNDYGIAIGDVRADGRKDYLNTDLIGAASAIFVGALEANGSVNDPAAMAQYSNIAGANETIQNQFLVVGVEGDQTNLYGTSFAAPVVAGYSAIIHSKFTKASPTAVANRLLETARTDTVENYSAEVYGRGEASLSRAIAPNRIQ